MLLIDIKIVHNSNKSGNLCEHVVFSFICIQGTCWVLKTLEVALLRLNISESVIEKKTTY